MVKFCPSKSIIRVRFPLSAPNFKRKVFIMKRLVLSILMVILLSIPTFSMAMPIEEIYEWVKERKQSIDCPMPRIYVYNDVEFNAISSELTLHFEPHNFYAFYCKGNILMRENYDDKNLFFDEVLAHEMVHHVQQFQNGDPFIDPLGIYDTRLLREWEARNIQEEFRVMFCK